MSLESRVFVETPSPFLPAFPPFLPPSLRPGSYLVRPSEKTLGDYALAFRTKSEVRHWKIVHDKEKFYVHPRPNPYDSLEDIIKVRKS